MQHYLFLLSFLLLSLPSLGTCIIVFKKGNVVYIGADSRNAKQRFDNTFVNFDDYCKIIPVNNYVFTFAGFDNDNLHAKIENALRYSSNPKIAFPKLELDIKTYYEGKLLEMQLHYPAVYREVHSRGRIAEIVIVHFEGATAKLKKYEIEMASPIASKPLIKLNPTDSQPGYPNIFLSLGVVENMQKNDYNTVFNQLVKDPIPTIKTLISGEMKHPRVGGPIDIIEISATGKRWIAKKANCRQ